MFDDYQSSFTEAPSQAQSPSKFTFRSPKQQGKLNAEPNPALKKSHFFSESQDTVPYPNGMIYPNEEVSFGNAFHMMGEQQFTGAGYGTESQQKMMNAQRMFNSALKFNSDSSIPNIQQPFYLNKENLQMVKNLSSHSMEGSLSNKVVDSNFTTTANNNKSSSKSSATKGGLRKSIFQNGLDNEKTQGRKSVKTEKEVRAEAMIQDIDKYEMNPISLLNEINGKLKKKAEYTINELSMGRNKVFECVCLLNGQLIGSRRGTSKQNAKAEAAKDGIYTILTNEQYLAESAVIILSIQKASERAVKTEKGEKTEKTQKLSRCSSYSNLTDSTHQSSCVSSKKDYSNSPHEESQEIVSSHNHQPKDVDGTGLNVLSELNDFAKKFSVEPIWSFPHETLDGDFEVELKFGDLAVKEKRRKKQEVKKEAALKMLKKIRDIQELENHFFQQTSTPSSSPSESIVKTRGDRARGLFNSTMKPHMLKKIENQDITIQQSPVQTKLNSEIETVIKNGRVDLSTDENLQVFFKKIIDYTSMTSSNPKQIMLEAEQHFADYVRDCHLQPIGSFALKCMRNDNLTIDALLTFKLVKEINEKELLELYRSSLETCQFLDQQAGTNMVNMNFQFRANGDFIEITEMKKSQGDLKIRIYLSKQVEHFEMIGNAFKINESNYQIYSVQKIYECFDQSLEELNEFRSLLTIMRIWRRSNGIHTSIKPEIFDAVLSHVLLTNRSLNASEKLMKVFTILSTESTIEVVLQKFDDFYLRLFKSNTKELRERLMKICKQTLADMVQGQFSEVYLFQFLHPIN